MSFYFWSSRLYLLKTKIELLWYSRLSIHYPFFLALMHFFLQRFWATLTLSFELIPSLPISNICPLIALITPVRLLFAHDLWQTDFISKFPTRHLRWSFSTLYIHLHACHTCVCTAYTWTRRPEASECLFHHPGRGAGSLASSSYSASLQCSLAFFLAQLRSLRLSRLSTLRQLLQHWHCSGGIVKSKTCLCSIHFQIRIPRTCSIVSWATCSR